MSREDLAATPSREAVPRAAPSSAPLTLAKPVRDALRCLLEQPGLAGKLPDLEMVASAEVAGVELLVSVATFFAEQGEANVARLLESWRERPEAATLAQLAAETLPAAGGEPGQVLREAWAHLRLLAQKARAARLLKESEVRSLSAPETAELRALTQQLARRPPV